MARRYDKQEYAVGCYKFNGVLVREYSSIAEASEQSGVRYSQIWACVNGRTQQAGGYLWKKMG